MARKLRVIKHDGAHPNQYSVESYDNDEYKSLSWEDYYVKASGYFGNIGPHVFAAAPDLLEALKLAEVTFKNYDKFKDDVVAMEAIRAAIAKAKGQDQ